MTTNLLSQTPKIWQVYFLGGQSNMDGLGSISDLPTELDRINDDVFIYHGNPAPDEGEPDGRGIWTPLQPGHGFGFYSDGNMNYYSDLFGLELSFANRMLDLQPDINLALVKYSRAATSIDPTASGGFGHWLPIVPRGNSVNQFDHFSATVKNALTVSDLDNDGRSDILIPAGFLWMQGESDAAYTKAVAERYEDNLKLLLAEIRKMLNNNDLPVAIGRISDSGQDTDGLVWNHGSIVRQAQQDIAASDPRNSLITQTDSLTCSDGVHYDSNSLIKLGYLFAESMYKLQTRNQ